MITDNKMLDLLMEIRHASSNRDWQRLGALIQYKLEWEMMKFGEREWDDGYEMGRELEEDRGAEYWFQLGWHRCLSHEARKRGEMTTDEVRQYIKKTKEKLKKEREDAETLRKR